MATPNHADTILYLGESIEVTTPTSHVLWKLPVYDTAFKNRGRLQTTSPLFEKLPAELRSMIYQEVLRHDKVLSLDAFKARRDGTGEFLRQAWSFLATCQQALHEASSIFYENIPQITIRSDGRYNLMKMPFTTPSNWDDVVSRASEQPGIFDGYALGPSQSLSDLLEIRKVLKRFPSIRVEIWDATPFNVYFAFTHLTRQVLATKGVTLDLLMGETADLAVQMGVYSDRQEFREAVLQSCQALRCAEFSLGTGENLGELKTIIEGAPLLDEVEPFQAFREFHKYLDAALAGPGVRAGFMNANVAEISEMQNALIKYDTRTFFETLSVLYDVAAQTGITYLELMAARAQAEIVDRITELNSPEADLGDDEE